MTYEQWLQKVNSIIWEKKGCSVYDLVDCLSRDWYESGMKPSTAARKAIKENRG